MPSFPMKRWLFNKTENVIEQRRIELQIYLNKVAKVIDLVSEPQLCKLIGVSGK